MATPLKDNVDTYMRSILGFADYESPARDLAKLLNVVYHQVAIHRFPDGESKITLPENITSEIIICQTLNKPNEKLIELIITAQAAREQGVKSITLVAPYLCYMRQDIAFNPGEAVSQKIIGELLAKYFDKVITIDPHLHRINNLSDAIPISNAIALKATQPMSEFLKQRFNNPVIIGPDEESKQWVSAISAPFQWDYLVASKQRLGDKNVVVSLEDVNLLDRDVVLIDDIASTGKTLEQAVKIIKTHNAKSISVLVTHAFFVDNAVQKLASLGVQQIWSSDSVLHPTNAFSIMPLIAEKLDAI